MFGFISPRKLRAAGVVGMNRRNARFIGPNNRRRFYKRVDDKLQTKLLCEQHNIKVPRLLGVVRLQHQISELKDFLPPLQQFVIKPANGSGGKGILVITGRDGDRYLKASGKALTLTELEHHVSNILSGLYSLGGLPDVAFFEALVIADDSLKEFSFEGVPDIRVILYHGYPVMAMARLSTRRSDGKANLHQGAVGVGLDLATGHALNAVQFSRPLERHPDTGKALKDLKVPHWRELLVLASRGYEMSELGYLGVDLVLDQNLGPLVLELNARPGLSIQLANGAGLAPRLKAIERIHGPKRDPEQRVNAALQALSALPVRDV
ncbi:MAG TPA: alpha-L-glutamate ligase-like protein [Spongiibacteraceae bacterium]|jgi:alpha-L-glutamate ligase-like protein|nr:alpha-L-glutamate ligase-like protein [Spongiibacteraceae bacterium]HUH37321.1 alpha-L-glutamate ligase-like protein [Spongiibacteraceae bacterium]